MAQTMKLAANAVFTVMSSDVIFFLSLAAIISLI